MRDNVKKSTGYNQHPSIGTNAYDRNLPVAIAPNSNFSQSSGTQQQTQNTPGSRSSATGQTVQENLDITFEIALTTEEMSAGTEKHIVTEQGGIVVKIPAPVSSGKQIRVRGKGKLNSSTQQRGDLYLVVKSLNTISVEDELRSSCGIDYKILRDFLVAQEWERADEETESILQLLCSRVEINHLACEDLWTIDQLWVKYSNRSLGFSVQRRIWQSVGGEIGKDCWIEFCQELGWLNQGNRITKEFTIDELRSKADGRSLNLLSNGYFPSFILVYAKSNWLVAQRFFSRIQECRL